MRRVEKQVLPRYFAQTQSEITEAMRAVLVDWLAEVHRKYKMHSDSLFLAVRVMDRFLSKKALPLADYQLLGVACLFLSGKYEEIYPPPLRHYTRLCQGSFSERQILDMEARVIVELGFDLSFDSPARFLGVLA
jgi:hypothetical protein